MLRFDGQAVEPESLLRMGRVITHRGPDDDGIHVDGPCGIGMRRLSIIDPSGGHQPISNADDSLWVVCNGEIYNFRELRAELRERGYAFKTGSDTEVILHLYDAYGDDFVQRLDGMFDFALWDARRRRLLIGRDQLGVKPLYVYRSNDLFAFATEAKALLALPEVPVDIDRAVLIDYLHLGYVAAPRSMFAGIGKLPPATLVAVEGRDVRERRYWRLPLDVESSRSEDDWRDAVRAAMEDAVHAQMVSDVPIGAFLSGGVDSSAVVAMMARHSEQPIKTYSIGFEGGAAETLYNELPYARRVATLFGTDHHEIMVRPDVVELLPRLIWHMDEPIADSALFTTYLVSSFARRDVKVILSGVGGDELFGGYRRYLGDRYVGMLNRLPTPVVRLLSGAAQHLPADRHGRISNVFRLARELLRSADLSPDERYRGYLQVLGRERAASMLVHPEDGGPDALGAAFGQAEHADPLGRMFAIDAATQLPDDLLMLTDKMSMAVSLECRVPLLDRRLVELAARMPASVKIRGGRLKHLMKDALRDVLPADILHREKRGFGAPIGAWIKRSLAPVVQTLLSRESVARRGLFRPEEVERLIAEHQGNRIDGTDAILALMNLEVWARIYLDRRSHDDVSAELAGRAMLEKAA
jgi:asparagine synthase (glutamine-hydrolysing)